MVWCGAAAPRPANANTRLRGGGEGLAGRAEHPQVGAKGVELRRRHLLQVLQLLRLAPVVLVDQVARLRGGGAGLCRSRQPRWGVEWGSDRPNTDLVEVYGRDFDGVCAAAGDGLRRAEDPGQSEAEAADACKQLQDVLGELMQAMLGALVLPIIRHQGMVPRRITAAPLCARRE